MGKYRTLLLGLFLFNALLALILAKTYLRVASTRQQQQQQQQQLERSSTLSTITSDPDRKTAYGREDQQTVDDYGDEDEREHGSGQDEWKPSSELTVVEMARKIRSEKIPSQVSDCIPFSIEYEPYRKPCGYELDELKQLPKSVLMIEHQTKNLWKVSERTVRETEREVECISSLQFISPHSVVDRLYCISDVTGPAERLASSTVLSNGKTRPLHSPHTHTLSLSLCVSLCVLSLLI